MDNTINSSEMMISLISAELNARVEDVSGVIIKEAQDKIDKAIKSELANVAMSVLRQYDVRMIEDTVVIRVLNQTSGK